MRRALGQNLLLALAALVFRGISWASFDFSWDTNIYGSLVWTLMAIHTYEYVAGMGETAAMIGVFWHGRFGDKSRTAVEVDSFLWYFIVASWVPIAFAIYLPHRLF